MTFPRPQQYSPLSLFLLFSLGIHIIGLGIFTIFSPKFIEEKQTQISIQIGGIKSSQSSALPKIKDIIPTQQPKPITPKVAKKAPSPIQQPKLVTPKVTQNPPTPVQQPKPIAPKVTQTTPTPVQQPKSVAPVVSQTTPVQQPKPKTQTSPTPVQQATPVTPKIPTVDKTKEISDKLDDVLNKKTQKKSSTDALADAQWSGTPRKTLSFPNLTAKIPQQYKSRGYGFSITAKITFSPQGWVSGVELLRASGDPRIDGIFRTELRKIRIEPSKKTTYDTITKTFTISVK